MLLHSKVHSSPPLMGADASWVHLLSDLWGSCLLVYYLIQPLAMNLKRALLFHCSRTMVTELALKRDFLQKSLRQSLNLSVSLMTYCCSLSSYYLKPNGPTHSLDFLNLKWKFADFTPYKGKLEHAFGYVLLSRVNHFFHQN